MSGEFSHGHALLIGVGQHSNPAWSIPEATRDVASLGSVLADPDRCGYASANVRSLVDGAASRQAILDGLEALRVKADADPEATVVVFFSGHGWLSPSATYHLVPSDARPGALEQTTLSAAAFNDALRSIKAARKLVLLDCCHAGGMAVAKELPPGAFESTAPPAKDLYELRLGAGSVVFSSCLPDERSWVKADRSTSIFTHHLVEALGGAGVAPGARVVRLTDLWSHLDDAVPRTACADWKAVQTPYVDLAATNFPVALIAGGKAPVPSPMPASPTSTVTAPSPTPVVAVVSAVTHDKLTRVLLKILPGEWALLINGLPAAEPFLPEGAVSRADKVSALLKWAENEPDVGLEGVVKALLKWSPGLASHFRAPGGNP